MRVSSVICCSASNGTLKSTRTKSRLPATLISRIVCLFMLVIPCASIENYRVPPISDELLFIHRRIPGKDDTNYPLEPFFSNEVSKVGYAAGIAPFVIVPGDDLDQVSAADHCRESIYDR